MKIRNSVLHAARRLAPALLLVLCTAAVILFAEGYYTFSFLEEGASLPSIFSPLGGEESTPGGAPAQTVKPGDTERVYVPAPSRPQAAMSEDDVLRLCGSVRYSPTGAPVLLEQGFSRSTEPYSASTSVLAYAGGFDFLPRIRSFYDGYETIVSYVRPQEMSEPEPVYSQNAVEIPAVQLYMGYLLMDDGTDTRVYTADGLYLTTYKTIMYERAFTRDRDGNPLFRRTNWKKSEEEAEYYTVSQDGMQPSGYEDLTDGRGLYFDYAPSYGLTDSSLIRLARRQTTITEENGEETREESILWAYGYSPAWRRTGYNYTAAYDFREGLAAVVKENGQLIYIGESGYQAFTTERNYYYFEWNVLEFLLPPLTSGPESIGFYYYDHGLVRARRQVVDFRMFYYYNFKRVALDEDFLMDTEGNEFPIPEGYDIVSYSDGVILLEQDGKYGYMDYTGAWIAQPIYDYARPFSEGLAVAGFSDGVRLMLDTEGNIVIPAGRYEYISDVSSGVIAVRTIAGTWEILHKMARFTA